MFVIPREPNALPTPTNALRTMIAVVAAVVWPVNANARERFLRVAIPMRIAALLAVDWFAWATNACKQAGVSILAKKKVRPAAWEPRS